MEFPFPDPKSHFAIDSVGVFTSGAINRGKAGGLGFSSQRGKKAYTPTLVPVLGPDFDSRTRTMGYLPARYQKVLDNSLPFELTPQIMIKPLTRPQKQRVEAVKAELLPKLLTAVKTGMAYGPEDWAKVQSVYYDVLFPSTLFGAVLKTPKLPGTALGCMVGSAKTDISVLSEMKPKKLFVGANVSFDNATRSINGYGASIRLIPSCWSQFFTRGLLMGRICKEFDKGASYSPVSLSYIHSVDKDLFVGAGVTVTENIKSVANLSACYHVDDKTMVTGNIQKNEENQVSLTASAQTVVGDTLLGPVAAFGSLHLGAAGADLAAGLSFWGAKLQVDRASKLKA